jgi:hypothetical protein
MLKRSPGYLNLQFFVRACDCKWLHLVVSVNYDVIYGTTQPFAVVFGAKEKSGGILRASEEVWKGFRCLADEVYHCENIYETEVSAKTESLLQ